MPSCRSSAVTAGQLAPQRRLWPAGSQEHRKFPCKRLTNPASVCPESTAVTVQLSNCHDASAHTTQRPALLQAAMCPGAVCCLLGYSAKAIAFIAP